MDRNDVIRMAREAGMEDIHLDGGLFYASPDDLIKFASHVAEDMKTAIEEALASIEADMVQGAHDTLCEAIGRPLESIKFREPDAYAVRTVGGTKWHSIHAKKAASDKWLEFRIKEQARDEQYEQVALYKPTA